MLITLTLKLDKTGKQMDIQVNSFQKIGDALDVLAENKRLPGDYGSEQVRVKSQRRKEFINTKLTFEQAEIYSGDCFLLIKKVQD